MVYDTYGERKMNIDKIYKPLKSGTYYTAEPEYFKMFNVVEVRELEEKYKELLGIIIADSKDTYDHMLDNPMFQGKPPISNKEIIERHTGIKWEDIISDK